MSLLASVPNAIAALLVAALPLLGQPTPPTQPKHKASSPLFASDTTITVTITGDWRALASDRDTLNAKLRPGTLAYVDASGHPVRIPVHLATRGHFRLSRTNCAFPPLRVVFDSLTKKTLFAGQKALKLGTHCNGSPEYEQYVLREYAAYRAHNAVTDLSFRPRLAHVRYVDARDTTKVVERWGMFLESERELAQRLGGKVLTARGGRYADVADSSAAMLGLWEYFIGNTDFSLDALHNVRIVAAEAGALAVPYDFDFSGLVDTRYATPDARLGIRTVRERLYRGPCLDDAALGAGIARFVARRDAIRADYDGLAALDRGYAKRALDYIDAFYKDVGDEKKFARTVKEGCKVGT